MGRNLCDRVECLTTSRVVTAIATAWSTSAAIGFAVNVLDDKLVNKLDRTQVQGSVELNGAVFTMDKHLSEFFFANDLEVGINKMVVLSLELFVSLLEDQSDFGGRLLSLQHLEKLHEISIIPVLLRVVLVQSLKSVIECALAESHLTKDRKLLLHLCDLIFLEVHLDLLMAELLKHIIEHNLGLVLVSWDLEGHDLSDAELFVGRVSSPLFERNERTSLIVVTLSAVHDEVFELVDWHVVSAIFVVFLPDSLEVLADFDLDGHLGEIGLTEEGIDDNGNEEVQEDLRDDNLEEKMERNGKSSTTALGSFNERRVVTTGNNRIEAFILDALV